MEVRDYMRHTLESAYTAMSTQTAKAAATIPPLANDVFMHELIGAIRERRFGQVDLGGSMRLEALYTHLVETSKRVATISGTGRSPRSAGPSPSTRRSSTSRSTRTRKIFAANNVPCDGLEQVHFHYPRSVPNEPAKAVFRDYVRTRWPIITFSLDPVTDQQNIADSFSLSRDLQLALSFAFSTGQINFNQLNTFRRQIQQSADTIALNRTVTGFMHSNDIFGFRFTPAVSRTRPTSGPISG